MRRRFFDSKYYYVFADDTSRRERTRIGCKKKTYVRITITTHCRFSSVTNNVTRRLKIPTYGRAVHVTRFTRQLVNGQFIVNILHTPLLSRHRRHIRCAAPCTRIFSEFDSIIAGKLTTIVNDYIITLRIAKPRRRNGQRYRKISALRDQMQYCTERKNT